MKSIPETILGHSELDEAASPLAVASSASETRAGGEKMVRSGFFSIFDQAVVSGTNFVTTLILARSCAPEELGVYSLAWTIVLFLTAIQCNLITVPYTMYCHRHEGESLAEYSGSTLIQQLLGSVGAVLCFLVLVVFLSLGYGPERLRSAVFVLMGVIPFILMRDYARRFALAHLAMFTAITIDVVAAVIQIATLLLLWRENAVSAAAVYAAMGGACAAAGCCWWLLNRRPLQFSPARCLSDFRNNWTFGQWAILSQLASLGFFCLPWMLAAVHGEAETGVLAACTTLVGLANLFVMGMNNYLMPKAAREYAAEGAGGLCRILRKALFYAAMVLGGLCVALYFTGNILATVIYGNEYAHAGSLIAMLSVATFTDAMGLTASIGLWAMDRPAVNLIGDAVQLAVTLAMALCLVFPHGPMGIAIALVIGRIVGAAVRWVSLRILIGPRHCRLIST